MKKIIVFGAGKSATSLIEYLCVECEKNNWQLTVCDTDLLLAQSKIKDCKNAEAISVNASDNENRKSLIQQADIVISMLPPQLHSLVAMDCIELFKHLLTASYIDENIRKLSQTIKEKGLIFLCEMGLDPGIDHMSAMKIINDIKDNGGKITSFKSHCGGLISLESDDNPWHYKITWNPANIVLAGSSGAIFKRDNTVIEKEYKDIFKDCKEVIVPGLNTFAWYPNRDSLSYIDTYGLHEINTFIRTTLRHPSFCHGWHYVVNLGLTDTNDYDQIRSCITNNDWFQIKRNSSLKKDDVDSDQFQNQIDFLGLQSSDRLPAGIKSSALLLQNILEKKLGMQQHDKDMIVMLHEIEYEENDKKKQLRSTLIVKGEDQIHTAMAKTVGLPLGLAAVLILKNKITIKGLHIPVLPEIYNAVLPELEKHQIKFNEEKIDL